MGVRISLASFFMVRKTAEERVMARMIPPSVRTGRTNDLKGDESLMNSKKHEPIQTAAYSFHLASRDLPPRETLPAREDDERNDEGALV